MGGDTIQEPTVVADHYGAARETLQTVLQGSYGVDVHVVSRLVKQQDVAFVLQGQREMEPVALASGENPAKLLLVRSGEIEPGNPCPGIYIPSSQADPLGVARYRLVNGLVGVDALMLLVDIGDLDGLSDGDRARIRSLYTHDQSEESGLSSAVRAYHTNDSGRREGESQMLEKKPVTEAFRHILELDDLIAQTGTVRNVYLKIAFFLLGVSRGQLLIGPETGFLLGLTGLGGHPDPFQLMLKGLAPAAFLFLLEGETLRLLVQPGAVVSLPRNAFSTVQLKNPSGHIVEEVTVMGYGDDRALVLPQVGL